MPSLLDPQTVTDASNPINDEAKPTGLPLFVRRLGRNDVNYLPLNEPDVASPIIVSYRPNDSLALLARMLNLIEGFEQPSKVGVRRSKT